MIETLKKDDISEDCGKKKFQVTAIKRRMRFKSISKSSSDILNQNKINKPKRRASLFCIFPTTRLYKSQLNEKLLSASQKNLKKAKSFKETEEGQQLSWKFSTRRPSSKAVNQQDNSPDKTTFVEEENLKEDSSAKQV